MANPLLQNKRGIIFGALDEQSIAWRVADKCVQHGAKITLTNAPVAMRFGKIYELGEKLNAEVIPADATSVTDLDQLLTTSMEKLGGKIDFILHSIGMSLNVRKGKAYTDLNYDFMQKTFDISAISFHKLMQSAWQKDAINDGGSILALTYIAAQRVFPDYNEMAESKALLESFARSFGYHFGSSKKVRVNTISQSPTMTTAGSGIKGFQEFFDYADKMSPLGNAPADACADYCVLMFSDLSRMVTMQNLYHDGGFSSMGMNPAILGLSNS
ncbi:MAG: SDR family oxidoreductase [Saprospiraceae bacterium]|jgi:enoyl-[acyl-carrier protein] reductase I|nr:SDR family oxidoreductase [Saprospiraceae bacterium]MBK7795009.1 SDR family oxidoreductase [Saprospiraceae bacterium]MBK9376894.1 SDR family oxidoreductase [Saprospiraceae bacterium]MBL0262103.1 SDR family oxidoreductase [Saprospiraceae bacterium]MBX7163142.1 SDR family oxidoreductase [Saprospiraceae bacterium]